LELCYETDGILDRSLIPDDIISLVDNSLDTIISTPSCCLVAVKTFETGLIEIEKLLPVLNNYFLSTKSFQESVLNLKF
jgi:hypothetical protein